MEGILRRELSYDYSVESDWLPAVAGALQDLAGEGGLNRAATLIVPGFRVLSKIIEVPVVERSKQAQAIAYETQQNIPYPLSEVVWGYEIFADDGIEIEMVVVAEKLEGSEEFCEEIYRAGFSPEAVLPAPVLSYHTLLGTGEGGQQEEIVFIDVGARTSELLYMKGKELFIRSVSGVGISLRKIWPVSPVNHFQAPRSGKSPVFRRVENRPEQIVSRKRWNEARLCSKGGCPRK